MDAYSDTKLILVKQAHAERRAEAAANRLAAHAAPRVARAGSSARWPRAPRRADDTLLACPE